MKLLTNKSTKIDRQDRNDEFVKDIKISNIESEDKVKKEERKRYETQPLTIEEKIFLYNRRCYKSTDFA